MITLRVYSYESNGIYRAINLETDIAVEARNVDQLKGKMREAISLYLGSFTPEEIQSGAYIRKAPRRYFVYWAILFPIFRVWRNFTIQMPKRNNRNKLISGKAAYYPESKQFKFA